MSITADSQFVNSESIATSAGKTTFEVYDNISQLSCTANLTIYPTSVPILLDNQAVTTIDLAVEQSLAIRLDTQFDDISVLYYDGENYCQTSDVVSVRTAIGMFLITGLKSGTTTLAFFINSNLVASLVVTVL